MARRGQNEGSIYKRADGRWAASLTLGYHNGMRKRKTFYGKTRGEVREQLTAALRTQQQGLPIVAERQTVAHYLTAWLATATPTVAPTTWERYEIDVRRHLIPALGRIRLAQLTPQQVQKLFADKLNAGLSPHSVRNMRAVLRRALNEAQQLGLVSRNVVSLVRAPKLPRGEMRVYDTEQTRLLLETARDNRLAALFVLAVTTGMRHGELLGLRWRNVNLDGRYVQVQSSLKQTVRQGLMLQDLKTASSRRKIVLTSTAVMALRQHRMRQPEERLAAGPLWQEQDLVFCNHRGGPLYHGNVLEEYYKPIQRRAGLPYIRFHDLRHTAATLMLLQGVHPKVVSEMLGHASVAITLTLYSHVLPDM